MKRQAPISSTYLEVLIRGLSRLPGIGRKSAARLAFHIIAMPREEAAALSRAILDLKDNISTCSICGGIADGDVCAICQNTERDSGLICVVEAARDIISIEASGGYTGNYHVLQGLISPLDGIGPEDLSIAPLVKRCESGTVREIILALNPSIEGEATSLYIADRVFPEGITVTRIARGLPVGTDLEFADTATIVKALEGRAEIK